jgi:hypothetical protein
MAQSPFGKILHPKKRAFLVAYASCGRLQEAATIAACDRDSHYKWKATDPLYQEAFARAKEMAADLHEDEATRRALGWDETRYADDGTPHTVRKYSDTLLIVRLKALKPDQYRDTNKRDERSEVSELLKAVLLELAERQHTRNVTPEAEWAPLPPRSRLPQEPTALPPPPEPDEEEG